MKTLQDKNIAIAKAFVMFLKANGAFVGYRRAVRNRINNHFTFVYFLKNFPKTEAISENKWSGFIFNAFAWCDTVECREDPAYWSRLHYMWVDILEQVIHNDYEISKDISRAILARSN